MPTVYSFGDSFSEDFDIFAEEKYSYSHRYDYIHNHLNGKIPNTFAKLIAEKLKYDYVCKAGIYGYEGNCNQSMYNNFFITTPLIKSGDIVFLGYTNPTRFKWFFEKTNSVFSVLPNNYPDMVSKDEKIVFDHISINRNYSIWCDEYRKMEILIQDYAKYKKFKVFFWSYIDDLYKGLTDYIQNNQNWLLGKKIINEYNCNINGLIFELGDVSIKKETKNKTPDSHYGEVGHKILSNLFLNEMIEKNLI